MTINRQEVLICQNSLCKNYELTIINKYIIDLNANTYLGFLQSWQTDGCNGRWPEGCGKKLQRINLKHFQSTYLIVTWKVIWDQIDNRDSVEGTFWVSFPGKVWIHNLVFEKKQFHVDMGMRATATWRFLLRFW